MNIQKADLKLFFKSHKEIADTMGVSKQWVDVIGEVKNPEQQQALRDEVKTRMKEIVQAFARIQESGNQSPSVWAGSLPRASRTWRNRSQDPRACFDLRPANGRPGAIAGAFFMYEDIKKKIPLLEDQDEMIGFILNVRETFNAKDVPFKVVVGQSHVGNIDKYLASIEKPCRCADCLTGGTHGETDRKRKRQQEAIRRRRR